MKPPSNGGKTADEVKIRIGKNLRAARLAAGLDQSELGSRSKLGPSYISRVESGGKNATVESLARLADALGISVSDLLLPEHIKESVSLPGHTVGAQVPPDPMALAIELPKGIALEVGAIVAQYLAKPIALIDPAARVVFAIVGGSITQSGPKDQS